MILSRSGHVPVARPFHDLHKPSLTKQGGSCFTCSLRSILIGSADIGWDVGRLMLSRMVQSILDIRNFWKPPFQYSLLVIAATTPKLLHLYSHTTSLPPLLYLLYLPTFLALDVLNAALFWSLVHFSARGWLSLLLSLIRAGVMSVTSF